MTENNKNHGGNTIALKICLLRSLCLVQAIDHERQDEKYSEMIASALKNVDKRLKNEYPSES